MAPLLFHPKCLIDLKGLYAGGTRGDRERIQSELDLLHHFGEEFMALFTIDEDLLELWIRKDNLHGVIFCRRLDGALYALAAWRGDDADERVLAIDRARNRKSS